MTTLQIIYDGNLTPDTIATSQPFSFGNFLLFDTVNLPIDEGIEIGFVLTVKVPVIGRTIEKDIVLPSVEFQGTLDSFKAIEIPCEYSDAGYEMECGFHSSVEVSNFRVYAIKSTCTIESTCRLIEEFRGEFRVNAALERLSDAAFALNQLSQNAAILTLGAGIGAALAPYTAGASLALPAAIGQNLLPGTAALSAGLLGGI
jgi:hypothetical protein